MLRHHAPEPAARRSFPILPLLLPLLLLYPLTTSAQESTTVEDPPPYAERDGSRDEEGNLIPVEVVCADGESNLLETIVLTVLLPARVTLEIGATVAQGVAEGALPYLNDCVVVFGGHFLGMETWYERERHRERR